MTAIPTVVEQCAVTLELHAFVLSNAPTLGPIIFITVPGDVSKSGAHGFCTSAAVKKRLARLLDLRLSTLKFCPEVDLNRFLKQRTLLAPTPTLLDSTIRADGLYNSNVPPILAESMKRDHIATSNQIVFGRRLQETLGASWLEEDDPLSNLTQLCNSASIALNVDFNERALYGTFLLRCARCNSSFPAPGSSRPSRMLQRCSRCRGDPEGMRTITRKVLALRFGTGTEEWQSLRSRLARAVKAGHAEAVRAIALAGNNNRMLSALELDLAIRCRRAGVLASVLSCCSLGVVQSCLKLTETHVVESGMFGGRVETSLFFEDLRRRLSEVHELLGSDRKRFEEQQRMGWLVMCRHGVQALPRQLMLQFLSAGFSAMICEQLSEMLAGIDGINIKLHGALAIQ